MTDLQLIDAMRVALERIKNLQTDMERARVELAKLVAQAKQS